MNYSIDHWFIHTFLWHKPRWLPSCHRNFTKKNKTKTSWMAKKWPHGIGMYVDKM